MSELYDELQELGYKHITAIKPFHFIDIEIAGNMRCKQCGSKMYWEGYVSPSSYIAFAVCTQCEHKEEF